MQNLLDMRSFLDDDNDDDDGLTKLVSVFTLGLPFWH